MTSDCPGPAQGVSESRLRALLLGGSALCGLALLAAAQPSPAANILPTQGVPGAGVINLATPGAGVVNTKILNGAGAAVIAGAAAYTSTGAAATVTLTAPRTLIDWATFEVGTGNTLNFNFTGTANDFVLNRVQGGVITVDAGGTVNGLFGGRTGGNIWFLAPNGVFLNGTVTAAGVLATNNAALADLNLLSDNIGQLKGELAAGGGLLDLVGVVTATGAQIDYYGDIILTGDVNTGAAGVVTLDSTGTISQASGVITASTVSGKSAYGASLRDANLFDTLGGFTNISFGVYIVDAQPTGLTITGPVDGGSGNVLQISATAGPLMVNASVTAASNAAYGGEVDLLAGAGLTLNADVSTAGSAFAQPGLVTLTAGGAIGQAAGVINAGELSASSETGNIILTQANQVVGLYSVFAGGYFALTDASAGGLSVSAYGVTAANINLTTTNGGPLMLLGPLSAAGGIVTLNSAGPIDGAGGGSVTATTLTGSSVGGTTLTSTNNFANLTGFTNVGAGGINIFDQSPVGLTISGAVDPGAGNPLTLVSAAPACLNLCVGPLTLLAPITLSGGSLTLSSAGALRIDAPINLDGSVAASLFYDANIPTNLSFAIGSGLTFNTATGGAATASQGGTLSINGQAYTLLYNLALPGSTGPDAGLDDVAGIDNNAGAGGAAGFYALAVDLAGTGTAANPRFAGPLAGPTPSAAFSGVFEGLGHTVTNLTINGGTYAGLFGDSTGVIRDVGLVGGVITSANGATTGALAGENDGTVALSYSSAAVSNGGADSAIGGLIGANIGTISQSFSTGPVSAISGSSLAVVGGVAGENGGTISQSYSTGPVAGFNSFATGGVVGYNGGAASEVYATGAISGTSQLVGGVVGDNLSGASVTGAFDTQTTGQATGVGLNNSTMVVSATPLTTSQAQGVLPANLMAGPWQTGPGLYPYLNLYYPAGVQAVSGVAFSDGGATPLPSGAADTVIVGVADDFARLGVATTGANGYYYLIAPAGAVTAGQILTASVVSGAPAATDSYVALGAVAQTGVNVYGAPLGILPTQGALNLGFPTAQGVLADKTLVGDAPTPGTVGYTSSGVVATIDLTASRTLIDWTTFEVGSGATLNFNFTGAVTDIVINRVTTGPITIDAGGAVNGLFGGNPGGGVWFLSPNGVFINGAVTAGGVLTSNNTSLSNLNLLADRQGALTSELAAGGAVLDVEGGAVSAAAAQIDPAGNITLGGNVDAGATGSVVLDAEGAVSQVAGAITTGTLSGTSSGGATLTAANRFSVLGGFANSGLGFVSITDDLPAGLTVTGPVSAQLDGVVLTANNGGALTLTSDITAGGAVNLVASGAISQTGGVITAGALTGTAGGAVSLNDANGFDSLGGFSAGAGDIAITDARASGFTLNGQVYPVAGNIILTTTNGGSIALYNNLFAPAGNVTLDASGDIIQKAGLITTGVLMGTSTGGAILNDNNNFGALGGFLNRGVGDLAITNSNANGFLVNAAVDADAGGASGNALTLTNLGAGPLAIDGSLSTAGGVTTLASAGPITQTAPIFASVLTGSSVGGAALSNTANSFDNLGPFTNTGVGDVVISDANVDGGGLTVIGPLDAGAGNNLTLNNLPLDGPTGPLTLAADLVAAGGAIDLNSAAAILQTGGAITTQTLSSTSNGANQLTRPNQVAVLGTFANGGAGDMSYTDGTAAGVIFGSDIDSGAGNLTLSSVNPGTSLTVTNNLTTQTGFTVTLNSAGPISQQAGVITTGALSGASAGGATLNDPNLFDTLTGFTNTGGVGVSIFDAQPTGLTVTGAVDVGAGNLLQLTTTAGPLTVNADLTAEAGGQIVLASAGLMTLAANLSAPAGPILGQITVSSQGPILQTAGVITTNGFIASGEGDVTLNRPNILDTLYAGSAGGTFSLTDASATGLTVTSDGIVGTNVNLTTTNGGPINIAALITAGGAFNVISGGAITEDPSFGAINVNTLSGSSVGGASFNGQNQIANLGPFANTGVGDFSLTDNVFGGLTVAGDVDAGVGNNLTLNNAAAFCDVNCAGPLTLAANLTAAGGTVDLISAGLITQTGGVIATATLTGSATGGVSLTGANLFDNLAGFTNTNGPAPGCQSACAPVPSAVSITDAQPTGLTLTADLVGDVGDSLTLTTNAGPLALQANVVAPGGPVSLVSAGNIDQTAGAITAESLSSVSAGDNLLTEPNQVATLTTFANGGAGNMSYTDATVAGVLFASDINAGQGSLTLTSTNPGTTLTLPVYLSTQTGYQVTLDSAGPISQTGGAITTGTLNGSSVGGATLANLGNAFASLGGFGNSGVGDVRIVDSNGTLMVNGDVDVGSGNSLFLTNASGQGPGGDLTLAASLSAAGGSVNLVSDGTITQTAGLITTATLNSVANGANLLTGPNQVVTLGQFANGGAGALSFTDAIASGIALSGAIDAGAGNLTLTSTFPGAALNIGFNLTTQAPFAVSLISAGPISQTAGVITTGGFSGMSVGGASLTDANLIGALLSFTNDDSGSITLANNQSLAVTGLVDNTPVVNAAGTGRDISVSVQGDLTGAGVFQAARDAALQATGAVSIGAATAGDDIVVRAAGGLQVAGGLAAGNGPAVPGAGLTLAQAAPSTLFGAAEPGLGAGSVDLSASTITVGGNVTAVGANADVRVVASGADPTGAAVQLSGSVSAGQDVAVDSRGGGILVGGSISAGRDAAAYAEAGALTLGSATAYGDVVLASPGGAVTLDGSVIAGAAGQAPATGVGQTLFNVVSGPLDGLFTLRTRSVFIAGAAYTNNGYLNETPAVIQAPGAIGILVTDPNGLALSNTQPDPSSWIDAPSLLAPAVSIFEQGGDLNIGTATIDASVANLNLYANGRVLVTGAFAPSTDSAVSLTIGDAADATWTPNLIEVINDSGPAGSPAAGNQGSIGVAVLGPTGAYGNTRTFSNVSLTASGDILLGTQAFVSANAAVTDPTAQQNINPNTPNPAVASDTSQAVLLAAADVSLSAGALIVQQNTNGLGTSNGVGAYITRSLTLTGYSAANPPRAIDLFGAFVSSGPGGGGLITGAAAAASTQISLSAGLATSPYRTLYRFNGCEIGAAAACGAPVAPVVPASLSTIGVVLDPAGQEDPPIFGSFASYPQGDGGPLNPDDPRNLGLPDPARGGLVRIVTGPMFDLWGEGLLAYDAQDIEDPTITGAPNEEIWRKPEDHP